MQLDRFQWVPLTLQPRKVIMYEYPNPDVSDLVRVCDFEAQLKWTLCPNDHWRQSMQKNSLSRNFKLLQLYSSGLDIVFIKAIYQAVQEGSQS